MTRAVAVILFLCFVALPSALGLGYALFYALGYFDSFTSTLTLAYFDRALNMQFARAIAFTLVLASAVIICSITLAAFALYFLDRKHTVHSIAWYYFIPMATPPVVAALFTFHWLGNSGFLARAASAFNFISDPNQFPSLVNDTWSIAVFLTHVMLTFPFFLIVFMAQRSTQTLQSASNAARTLGASYKERFYKVTLPILLRQNAPLIAVWFIFILGTYEVPIVLGSQAKRPITIFIIDLMRGYDLQAMPVAYAMVIIYAVLVAALAALLSRIITKRYAA